MKRNIISLMLASFSLVAFVSSDAHAWTRKYTGAALKPHVTIITNHAIDPYGPPPSGDLWTSRTVDPTSSCITDSNNNLQSSRSISYSPAQGYRLSFSQSECLLKSVPADINSDLNLTNVKISALSSNGCTVTAKLFEKNLSTGTITEIDAQSISGVPATAQDAILTLDYNANISGFKSVYVDVTIDYAGASTVTSTATTPDDAIEELISTNTCGVQGMIFTAQ